MRKYVIALYIRLSLEDSKTESLSIVNQRLVLRQYAETLMEDDSAEIEILEFVDNGYSGTNFERPAVQELLELVRGYGVDCIIVKDFSRFGRNSIETGYFIERVFPLYRVRFVSVYDNFDTKNYQGDTGGLDVAFKYLVGELYSRDMSQKTKAAKYAKMRRGEYISKICPYGYKKGGDNRLAIDDEAATVVRLIFNLSLQGNSAQQIATTLYERNIPTPGEYKVSKGSKTHDVSRAHHIWQRSSVLRILADERYVGTYIMGKYAVNEIGGNRVHLKDENEWFRIPGHHPAIIDKTTFEQVQARITRFKSEKRNTKMYPLRGKVFCGCCEHALYRGKKDPEYSCRFTRNIEGFACHDLAVKESELEAMLFEIVSRQAEVVLGIGHIQSAGELNIRLTEQSEYERLIQKCKSGKMNLYEQYLTGEIDEGRYKELKAVYDAELNDLNRLYSALAAKTAKMRLDNEERAKIQAIARDISNETTLTRALAETLIEKLYIHPCNRVEIEWKIKDFAECAFEYSEEVLYA